MYADTALEVSVVSWVGGIAGDTNAATVTQRTPTPTAFVSLWIVAWTPGQENAFGWCAGRKNNSLSTGWVGSGEGPLATPLT